MVNYVELYAGLVRAGKITLDRVPAKYREAVELALNSLLTEFLKNIVKR